MAKSNTSREGQQLAHDTIVGQLADSDLRSQGNMGLLFQRYLPWWDFDGEKKVTTRVPLEKFVRAFEGAEKHQNGLLGEFAARRRRLHFAETSPSALLCTMRTVGRMMTGVGAPHPVEVGFLFHRTLGVPYLPGSTVKGLCRAAAEMFGASQDDIDAVFGPEGETDEDPRWVGGVVFHDAIPAKWPKMTVDILNPHHGSYYQGKGEPGDWESPVPVFFLAMEPRAELEFLFGLTPLGEASMLDKVWDWLRQGLVCLGIGAKTSAGYGYFESVGQPVWSQRHGVALESAPGAARAKTLRSTSSRESSFMSTEFQTAVRFQPVTVFLSHNWADKDRVAKVAVELEKLGVSAWLDKSRLFGGDDLGSQLPQAIRKSATVALFLSTDSVKSDWVDTEVRMALQLEDSDRKNFVVPVFLEDPETLVRKSPALRHRWIDSRVDKVSRVGILAQSKSDADIARELARSAFRNAAVSAANTLGILVDVRGVGRREGPPEMNKMPEVAGTALGYPLLLFRPDAGERSFREVLDPARFGEFANHWNFGLGEALGSSRHPREIYIGGDAPYAVFYWLVGRRFDRTSGVTLYCYNSRFKSTFNDRRLKEDLASPAVSRKGYERFAVTDDKGENWRPCVGKSDLGGRDEVAVVLAAKTDASPADRPVEQNAGYTEGVMQDNRDHEGDRPLLWVPSDASFTSTQRVQEWIKMAVEGFGWLKAMAGVRRVNLYMTIPNNVVPLLAAQLTEHVAPEVTVMEWTPESQGRKYLGFPEPPMT